MPFRFAHRQYTNDSLFSHSDFSTENGKSFHLYHHDKNDPPPPSSASINRNRKNNQKNRYSPYSLSAASSETSDGEIMIFTTGSNHSGASNSPKKKNSIANKSLPASNGVPATTKINTRRKYDNELLDTNLTTNSNANTNINSNANSNANTNVNTSLSENNFKRRRNQKNNNRKTKRQRKNAKANNDANLDMHPAIVDSIRSDVNVKNTETFAVINNNPPIPLRRISSSCSTTPIVSPSVPSAFQVFAEPVCTSSQMNPFPTATTQLVLLTSCIIRPLLIRYSSINCCPSWN